MIVYEHSIPFGVILTSLLVALALGIFSAWKSLPRKKPTVVLLVLYVFVLAGMGWCILQPALKDVHIQLVKPRFLVALDTSKSMSLSASSDIPSRWATAQDVLKQSWVQHVGAECDVEIYPFSSDIKKGLSLSEVSNLQPDGTDSRIREALNQLQERSAGLPVAGLLLLSDGIDTVELMDDWATKERPFPIYAVRLEPPGGWEMEPDLRIESVDTSRRVTVGWKSEMKVKVSGQGSKGTPVNVQVYENNNLLTEKQTQIPNEGGEREVVFELERPKVGTFNYRVLVQPLSGEKNTQDNERLLDVEVIDARNRLLYVEGVPRWEYKYLRRVLLSNKQVTPLIFFTGPDGKPRAGTPMEGFTPEMLPDQLKSLKIVMLGNVDMEELGPQRAANLLKFVEDGGSLVFLGGTKAWSSGGLLKGELAKAMPVRASQLTPLEGQKPFPVKLSSEASAHPAFAGDPQLWQNIPPVLSVFRGGELSPGAETLVTAQTPQGDSPVVVTQRFGQGKVTAILTDSLWRWQLDPEAGKNQPYDRFWTQLISWLLPQAEVIDDMRLDLFADRDEIYFGESIEIQSRFGSEKVAQPKAVDAKIKLPDGREIPYRMESRQITTSSGKVLSGFALPFQPEVSGQFKVVVNATVLGKVYTSEPFTFFVKPFSPETLPQPAKMSTLAKIAQSSGGQFYESTKELDEALSALKMKATEEKISDYRTIWRTWPVLIIVMMLITASWIARKLQNMP